MSQYLFIYNARSGAVNAVFDSLHKVFSPSTYQCNLCKITYGVAREKSRWQQFRLKYADKFRFLHIDEYESEFSERFTYPVVLTQNGQTLSVFVSTGELNNCKDEDQLIALIERQMKDADVPS